MCKLNNQYIKIKESSNMWDFFCQSKFLSSYPHTEDPCDISAYSVY